MNQSISPEGRSPEWQKDQDMYIQVRTEMNYGVLTVYPFCDKARTFASIAGTKTLPPRVIRLIHDLGYKIENLEPCLAHIEALAKCINTKVGE